MTRPPIRIAQPRTAPRALASSALLALLLAACGGGTSIDTGTATGVGGAPAVGSSTSTSADATAGAGGAGGVSESSASAGGAGATDGSGGAGGADVGGNGDGGSAPMPPDCPTSAPAIAPYKGINDNPKFLQVYDDNVENLELPTDQCAGDWQDLFAYMKLNPSPDVFLVQQISGKAQLDALAQYMTNHLPGVFEGIVAEDNPAPMKSPCGPPKRYQTNAIIYRTGRLTPVGDKHVYQSWANIQNECKRNFQARTKIVMQKFHDTVADKMVTIASIHWSTAQGTGPDPACAKKNVEEVAKKLKMAGFGGDLLIFGGDTNERDRNANGSYRPWYAEANGDIGGALGFRDSIFVHCKEAPPLQQCLNDNWTCGGDNRIDFVFAKRGDGCMPITSRGHTIAYPEGDAAAQQVFGSDDPANYSGHKSLRVEVHY